MAAANPFHVPAIADAHDRFAVTVRTRTIVELLTKIDENLAAADGEVLALIGGYGCGKTHIAGEVLRHVDGRARGTYLRARGTFVGLFREFVDELGPDAVRAAMESRYRDAVADVIAGFGLPEDVARHLLAEATTSTHPEHSPWSSSRILLEQVQPTVEAELRDPTFAAALTLLLRTGFDDAVIEWIKGGKPAAVLVDRGIEHAIDTDVTALEALGVLLLLCGRGTVLVIDELHAVPLGGPGVVEAVKKLFEVAVAAGTVVVLAGAPDYLKALPGDVVQRIGRVLEVEPLTPRHVAELVTASQYGYDDRLDGTNTGLMWHIAELTNGNPRNVVRLCHQLYRHAVPARFTDAEVRDVALGLFRDATPEHVHTETSQVLTALRLPYTRDHGGADYFVPGLDVALLVVDAVLDDRDCTSVADRVEAVWAAGSPAWPQVIIVGNVVPSRYLARLTEICGAAPLCYDYRTFRDDLRDALAARIAGTTATTTAHEEAAAAFAAQDPGAVLLLDALGRAYDELCVAIPADWLPVALRSLSAELRAALRRRR